jgi:hypothetical protein
VKQTQGPNRSAKLEAEIHHVVKRTQADFDLDRLVALCPPCHARTYPPYRAAA